MKYDYIIKNAKLVDFDTLKTYPGKVYVRNGVFAAAPEEDRKSVV